MRKLKSSRWGVRVAAILAAATVGALTFASSASAGDYVWTIVTR